MDSDFSARFERAGVQTYGLTIDDGRQVDRRDRGQSAGSPKEKSKANGIRALPNEATSLQQTP